MRYFCSIVFSLPLFPLSLLSPFLFLLRKTNYGDQHIVHNNILLKIEKKGILSKHTHVHTFCKYVRIKSRKEDTAENEPLQFPHKVLILFYTLWVVFSKAA